MTILIRRRVLIEGSSGSFLERNICHLSRLDIGEGDFKIVGNGMRYTHGTGNVLIFLFDRIDKDII